MKPLPLLFKGHLLNSSSDLKHEDFFLLECLKPDPSSKLWAPTKTSWLDHNVPLQQVFQLQSFLAGLESLVWVVRFTNWGLQLQLIDDDHDASKCLSLDFQKHHQQMKRDWHWKLEQISCFTCSCSAPSLSRTFLLFREPNAAFVRTKWCNFR